MGNVLLGANNSILLSTKIKWDLDKKTKKKKIVVVNQAVNYLTIGICNAFAEKFDQVDLVTGSVHVQGEELNPNVRISPINKWVERPASKKMWSYVVATLRIILLLNTRFRKHESFFVSIPPMAYLASLLHPNRSSILVWDVYPDVFKISGMKESNPMYRIWAHLNRIAFRKAFRLYTISETMADLLTQYVEREKVLVTPLWSIFSNNEKIPKEENFFVGEHGLEDKFVVQYSGNIGLTHRVEVLVELAEMMASNDRVLFQIIGRGLRKPALEQLVTEKKLKNCTFLPFQPDEVFPYSLSAADMGVVILDAVTAKGSVPSKTYNLMSFGIPTLYIASEDSELYRYSQQYRNGKCFREDELDKAAAYIQELSQDRAMHEEYAQNALIAAQNFKRSNADAIVDLYLQPKLSSRSAMVR